MKKQLLFGTNNLHKLREIREMLADRYEILSLKDLGQDKDVEETEETLEGNARLKAETYYAATQIPCFADDTGLEVEALNGAPGVRTARYAGPDCLPQDNIDKMLREMSGKENRKASFRTVIACYDGKQMFTFEGEVEGAITHDQKGQEGFGYDPIFQPNGYDKTFAELDQSEKHKISHRGKAVRKFVEFLTQIPF